MVGVQHQYTAADLSDRAKLPDLNEDSFNFLWKQLGEPEDDYSQLLDIENDVTSHNSERSLSPCSFEDSAYASPVSKFYVQNIGNNYLLFHYVFQIFPTHSAMDRYISS